MFTDSFYKSIIFIIFLILLSGCPQTSDPLPEGSQPTLTSVSPDTGDLSGSTVVRITGTNLYWPPSGLPAVLFGSTPGRVIDGNGRTYLDVEIPEYPSEETVNITVSYNSGSFTLENAFDFKDIPAPVVTVTSPAIDGTIHIESDVKTIQWNTDAFYFSNEYKDKVTIFADDIEIATQIDDTGSFDWTVGNLNRFSDYVTITITAYDKNGKSSSTIAPGVFFLTGDNYNYAVLGEDENNITDKEVDVVTSPTQEILQFFVKAGSSSAIILTSITFATSGTGDDTADFTAYLYEDTDGNGIYNSGTDTLLSTAPAPAEDNGDLVFSSVNSTVSAGGKKSYLVVYVFSGTPTAGNTYTLGLDSKEDWEINSLTATKYGRTFEGAVITVAGGD